MSNYVVIRSDELYHHGVLGMKWGVRRYQNKDGSLTPAGKERLAKYKQREIERLSYYDKKIQKHHDKAGRLIEKIGKRVYEGKKVKAKSVQRIVDEVGKQYANEAMKMIEHTKISEMTYDDMKKEKVAVGKNVATSVLLTAGAFGLSTAVHSPVTIITLPNPRAAKTNHRVDQDTMTKVNAISYEKALRYYQDMVNPFLTRSYEMGKQERQERRYR